MKKAQTTIVILTIVLILIAVGVIVITIKLDRIIQVAGVLVCLASLYWAYRTEIQMKFWSRKRITKKKEENS